MKIEIELEAVESLKKELAYKEQQIQKLEAELKALDVERGQEFLNVQNQNARFPQPPLDICKCVPAYPIKGIPICDVCGGYIANESERFAPSRQRVKIVPVTKLDPQNPTFDPHKPYVWQDYAGWEGRILRESSNGGAPAWYVSISGDGQSFVKMHINKTDIELCQ